jgi:hypothetical protein
MERLKIIAKVKAGIRFAAFGKGSVMLESCGMNRWLP